MPTDAVILICALLGVGRAIEVARGGDRVADGHHGWMRLGLLLLLALWAIGDADGWRGWLYALLMPAGAYYVARAIGEPMARARWA